jgi:hypothetical protein
MALPPIATANPALNLSGIVALANLEKYEEISMPRPSGRHQLS